MNWPYVVTSTPSYVAVTRTSLAPQTQCAERGSACRLVARRLQARLQYASARSHTRRTRRHQSLRRGRRHRRCLHAKPETANQRHASAARTPLKLNQVLERRIQLAGPELKEAWGDHAWMLRRCPVHQCFVHRRGELQRSRSCSANRHRVSAGNPGQQSVLPLRAGRPLLRLELAAVQGLGAAAQSQSA